MRWRSVTTTTAISAALAGYLLLMREQDNPLTDVTAPAQPGYYLKQALITETGADGVRTQLRAAHIQQNLDDNSISLSQVNVDYHSDAQRHWLLSADSGWLPAASRTIRFNGNVHVRPQDPGAQAPQVFTGELSIDTARNVATAPGAVRLLLDGQQLTAVGMDFDFNRQRLRLESQVNGQFRTPANR